MCCAYAPITEGSWSLIDDEARERLTPALSQPAS